ncbi:MAG: cytochrome c peroxidase [Isosphaeraceae bacterium]|nr:cytochrome c peroxidase [Isosphaeraceae bacterium]
MAIAFALAFAGRGRAESPEAAVLLPTHFRQPVALRLSPEGSRLYTANFKSGTVSVIDTNNARVVAECWVGRGLADLTLLPDGHRMLAVDRAADALVLLEIASGGVKVVARQEVAPDPVRVLVSPDGSGCAVTSTAARRVSIIAIDASRQTLTPVRTIDLPFGPREFIHVADGSRLVVADAYGGKLAVVDPSGGIVESVRSIPAHNIRGLALSPDGRTVVAAHEVLRRVAKTDFEDVHWGRLVTSHVRSLRLDALLSAGSDEDLLRGGCTIDLGFATSGAGDPSALACDRSGRVAVAVGGVDEVALSQSPTGYVKRIGVGRRPSALAISPDGRVLYVADTFDDTISVVDVANRKRVGTIALGPCPRPGAVERGERLFFDAKLSHDGWMSCHSCHTDGHSNGLLADTLGDGSYGAPKRVPSLLGVGATGPWAWSGLMERLEDQVRKSITVTMQGRAPTTEQLADLTTYLRSLPHARVIAGADEAAVARGRELFELRRCDRCHAGPEYTARGHYDVGIADEVGNRRFNPPSLRGVGQRESLLHDGRAATLGDLFLRHRHPRSADWTAAEVDDLVAFLNSL